MNNIKPEVAVDLIKLVNEAKGFEKTGKANMELKNGRKLDYKWIILDNILTHVKSNQNFGLMQPLGLDLLNRQSVKNILIHKSGEVIESDWFPIGIKEEDSEQTKGIRITYMRRYSLGAFLGVSTETDNDGDLNTKTDAEAVEEYLKETNSKAQKEITKHFNLLVTKLGSKDEVYKVLGMDREKFLTDFNTTPQPLLEQVKRHVK